MTRLKRKVVSHLLNQAHEDGLLRQHCSTAQHTMRYIGEESHSSEVQAERTFPHPLVHRPELSNTLSDV